MNTAIADISPTCALSASASVVPSKHPGQRRRGDGGAATGAPLRRRSFDLDRRVAGDIADPDNVACYCAVRGRAIGSATEGAATNIDEISQKYLGIDYPASEARTRPAGW